MECVKALRDGVTLNGDENGRIKEAKKEVEFIKVTKKSEPVDDSIELDVHVKLVSIFVTNNLMRII